MCKFEEFDYDTFEPTLADEIFAEASKKLTDALKADAMDRIRAITTDNERLQLENQELRKQATDVAEARREVEREKERIKKRAKSMTVREFLGMHAVEMFRAKQVTDKPLPKCNKCDDNRVIRYKTPLGKDASERCDCGEKQYKYIPEKLVISELKKDRHYGLLVWFAPYPDHGDGYSSTEVIKSENIYQPGREFSRNDIYALRFREKRDCKKYCDWLNTATIPSDINKLLEE